MPLVKKWAVHASFASSGRMELAALCREAKGRLSRALGAH